MHCNRIASMVNTILTSKMPLQHAKFPLMNYAVGTTLVKIDKKY